MTYRNYTPSERSSWPIIVGGVHRSGTSMMRRVLNAHSRIYCGPEPNFWRDFYNDTVEDPIRSRIAGFVTKYIPIQLSDDRFLKGARAMLPEDQLLDILGGALVQMQERAAANAGKARWADKDPANVVYLQGWQQLLGDQWVFLHIVRNPLDTIASIKEIRFPWVIPSSLSGRIEFYRRYVQAGLDFGAAHPDRYFRVLYDQVVANPEPVLRNLMAWLGESFEPGQVAFNERPQQAGIEDPKVAKTRGIHGKSVGRWQNVLTSKEAQRISQELGPLWRQVDPQEAHASMQVQTTNVA